MEIHTYVPTKIITCVYFVYISPVFSCLMTYSITIAFANIIVLYIYVHTYICIYVRTLSQTSHSNWII